MVDQPADRYPGPRRTAGPPGPRPAHIVEFLAAALYADDSTPVTGFTAGTGQILVRLRCPGGALRPALDRLAGQLIDLPRSDHLLGDAEPASRTELDALFTTADPG